MEERGSRGNKSFVCSVRSSLRNDSKLQVRTEAFVLISLSLTNATVSQQSRSSSMQLRATHQLYATHATIIMRWSVPPSLTSLLESLDIFVRQILWKRTLAESSIKCALFSGNPVYSGSASRCRGEGRGGPWCRWSRRR